MTYSNRFDFEWTSSQFFFKFRISMGFQTFFRKKNPTEFPMSSAWSALAWSYCHIAPHLQDSRTTSLQRKNLLNPKVSRRISWTFSQFETRVKTKKHLQHVSCFFFLLIIIHHVDRYFILTVWCWDCTVVRPSTNFAMTGLSKILEAVTEIMLRIEAFKWIQMMHRCWIYPTGPVSKWGILKV